MNPSGPTKTAERVVEFFVPPACREEVLGDLYERWRSPGQYWFDALRTVPLVIASRVRRTTDLHMFATLALATYASFLGAAFFGDRGFVHAPWGLWKLAVPIGPALAALMLEDAYAKPGRRSPLESMRGPVIGLLLAVLLQGVLWVGARDLALPRWLMLYGGAMSLFLISGLRMLFPQADDRPQRASGPALALAQAVEPVRLPHVSTFGIAALAVVMICVLLKVWEGELGPRSMRMVIGLAAGAAIMLQLNKRA